MYVILNQSTGNYLAFCNQDRIHRDTLDIREALDFNTEDKAIRHIGHLVSRGVLAPNFRQYEVVQIMDDKPSTPPAEGDPLTFTRFQYLSKKRNEVLTDQCGEDDWTHGDWGNALAGEVGEACNVIKKIRRGWSKDGTIDYLTEKLAEELADVVSYAALVADRFSIDLGQAVVAKFNKVSERYGVDIKL